MKHISISIAATSLLVAGLSSPAWAGGGHGQDTCTGYEHKVENLSGLTYTITPTAGEQVTGWCVKFSTELRTGTGNVIDISDQKHDISHVAWNDAPVIEPTETPTVPTETPTVPTETPSVPTETPTVPTETPSVPTETPTVPKETSTPTVPTETPTVPVTPEVTPPTETPSEEPTPNVPDKDKTNKGNKNDPTLRDPYCLGNALVTELKNGKSIENGHPACAEETTSTGEPIKEEGL